MNKDIANLIKNSIEDIYNKSDTAIMLFYHNDIGGISNHEIEYNIAEKLKIGDTYIRYSINERVPCKNDFIMCYQVVEKIIDENNNIILIVHEKNNVDVNIKKVD
ncbi:hypothetical protein [Clostridiisalibacter paucivorans]|uniref:hypothetical protein n=1 Tax=Clostridiisalibacter paucivorans TaxID=408753 RepID=UPI0004791CA3|nr:hypothetical protein [Clostridiisalibacter paucivorans]